MIRLAYKLTSKEHVFKFYKKTEDFEQLVGSFHIINKPDCNQIWCFGIHAEQDRGKGFGQQMLLELLDKFNDMPLELGCLKNNYRALHIYNKFGFTIVKDCGGYYWLRKEVK